MRITIFAVGTQGDIRPFTALARGLIAAGHAVRIATSENFRGLVTGFGVDFAPLTADYEMLIKAEPDTMEHGLNIFKVASTMRRRLREMAEHWAAEGRAACHDADLLIGAGSATVLVASLSEALGIPCVQAQLQPMTPCREIPPVVLPPPRRPLPGLANLILYHILRVVTWRVISPSIDGVVRPQLGLRSYPWIGPYYSGPATNRRVLYGYSRHMVPKSPDWSPDIEVAGYWFLDEAPSWTPPDDLARFLAAGPAPLYAGFGSMVSQDAERLRAAVLAAVRASGRRAILATGWGGLGAGQGQIDDQIFVLKQAPHDWLFPRVALAIHHGGAGTTAAAARAGIPSVVVPFFGDQPFWAHRLAQLGAAPPYLDRRGLTAERLGHAIAAAGAPAMGAAAAALGARIRAEDGIANAVARLDDWGLLGGPSAAGAGHD